MSLCHRMISSWNIRPAGCGTWTCLHCKQPSFKERQRNLACQTSADLRALSYPCLSAKQQLVNLIFTAFSLEPQSTHKPRPLPQAQGRNYLCTSVQLLTRLHSSVQQTPISGFKTITLSQFTELCSQQQWSCTACTHACPSHEACERHARRYCMSAEAKVLNYSTSCDRNSRSSLQTSQTSRWLPGSSAWKAQSELQNWVCWRQRNEVEPAWIWIYDSRDPEWTKRPKLSFPSSIKAPDVSVYTTQQCANPEWHC